MSYEEFVGEVVKVIEGVGAGIMVVGGLILRPLRAAGGRARI